MVPALYTVFTPPASCFAPTFVLSPGGNDALHNGTASRGVQSECYPPSFALLGGSVSISHTVEGVAPVYAPGVCPKGYSTASSNFDGGLYWAYCCPV